MLTIWAEGLGPDVNALKILHESLIAINQKNIAGKSFLNKLKHTNHLLIKLHLNNKMNSFTLGQNLEYGTVDSK